MSFPFVEFSILVTDGLLQVFWLACLHRSIVEQLDSLLARPEVLAQEERELADDHFQIRRLGALAVGNLVDGITQRTDDAVRIVGAVFTGDCQFMQFWCVHNCPLLLLIGGRQGFMQPAPGCAVGAAAQSLIEMNLAPRPMVDGISMHLGSADPTDEPLPGSYFAIFARRRFHWMSSISRIWQMSDASARLHKSADQNRQEQQVVPWIWWCSLGLLNFT